MGRQFPSLSLRKAIVFVLFIIPSLTTIGQHIKYSERKGRLEISRKALYEAKLNGAVSIESIIQSQANPDVLRSLGEPLEVKREEVANVGHTVTYIYDGLAIHFSALRNPELHIQSITLTKGSELKFGGGAVLKTGSSLSTYIDDFEEAQLDVANGQMVVAVHLEDSDEWIRLYREDGKVQEMTIFLGYDN